MGRASLFHMKWNMADKKPPQGSAEDQLKLVFAMLKDQQFQITQMQRMGGFADSKALSMRSTRLEDRTESLEFDVAMLKDLSGLTVVALGEHLKRHGVDLVSDNTPDTLSFRKIMRRVREWADKNGLMKKRNDLIETRWDENRVRPAEPARV